MACQLTQLGLSGILKQGFAISKDHFGLLFTITLMTLVPFSLVVGLITAAITPEAPGGETLEVMQRAQELQQEALLDHWPFYLAVILLSIVIYSLTSGALIQAIGKVCLGQPVTALEAVRFGIARLGPLTWTYTLTLLAVAGGMLLCLIPGIYFAIWFGLSLPVVVLEGLNGPAAMRRSKRIVHPVRGKFLALALILIVITVPVSWGAQLIPQPHLRVIGTSVVEAATAIVWSASFVVFYFSCRDRVEDRHLRNLAQTI